MIPTHAGALMPHPAQAAGASLGWGDPVNTNGGYAHANSGVSEWILGTPVIDENTPVYVGIVGYSTGVVVWDPVWTPVGSDPGPSTTPLAGGVLQVLFPFIDTFFHAPEGLLTVTATVDGVPTDSVEIALGPANYNLIAWGPTP